MAFNPAPTSWIASWSEDTTNVTFPLASLSATLTAAEADAATGDWRKCFWSILEHSYAHYLSLPALDRPTKVVISKTATQQSNGELLNTFTVKFYTAVVDQNVTAEPV